MPSGAAVSAAPFRKILFFRLYPHPLYCQNGALFSSSESLDCHAAL
jgi:hypothetical protein